MLRDGFNNDENMVQKLMNCTDSAHGKPAEVSKLALLLAEDRLGFINGANICIDGGKVMCSKILISSYPAEGRYFALCRTLVLQ